MTDTGVALSYNAISQDQYAAIGKFIVEFSRLEGSIKLGIAMLTPLPEGIHDELLAGYDFGLACSVLSALGRKRLPADEAKKLDGLISSARSIGDDRNRVAHGSWQVFGPKFYARHVSRHKLTPTEHFEDSAQLLALADRALKANLDVFGICFDCYLGMGGQGDS